MAAEAVDLVNRSFRRWMLATMALVAVALGVYAYLDKAAAKSLIVPMQARERRVAEDRSAARSRPPLLEPAEAGDAIEFYRSLADARPVPLTADTADDAVARALRAAHQPLNVPAGAVLDPARGDDLSDPPFLATWAGSFVGASLGKTVAKDRAAAIRCAAAGLVVAWDGLAFGRIDEAKAFDEAARDTLIAARKALSIGVADVSTLAEFARLLDTLAARPLPTRDAAWEFAVAEAKAAGGSSAEDTWETPHFARPGARWLWCESIAREAAVGRIRDEAAQVLAECCASPDGLCAASEAARARWESIDNPYLHLVLHAKYETVRWAPEPIVKPAVILEARRAWHERLAVARAAVAIARFAADRHALPKTLDEIVPTFAATTPTDPTRKTPLRYENGLVWAIGADGKDDDGRPAEDLPGSENIPDGDVVWRVAAPK
jgi:hypothetical protein